MVEQRVGRVRVTDMGVPPSSCREIGEKRGGSVGRRGVVHQRDGHVHRLVVPPIVVVGLRGPIRLVTSGNGS